MASLRDKVVLITGASSGIGAETARHFASLGSYLSLCGRNKENLEKVGKECEANGLPEDKILLLRGDLTNEDHCKYIIDKTIEKFVQLDVLVNIAGITKSDSIENTSLELFDFTMNINLRVVVNLTMLAVPFLIKTKGAVVNVSSIYGFRPATGYLSYAMSKSALDQFTNCIALELAPKQVRVNSVNPGIINTPLLRGLGMSDDDDLAKFLEYLKTVYPIGHSGEVGDVAKAIAFLASDDASFITATQLPVDGGFHAACPR